MVNNEQIETRVGYVAIDALRKISLESLKIFEGNEEMDKKDYVNDSKYLIALANVNACELYSKEGVPI